MPQAQNLNIKNGKITLKQKIMIEKDRGTNE
jgi:hypothetical protein